MTPIMHARGKWELLDPYRTLIKDDVSYTCNGINDFGKILAEGVNIFEAYYKPYGLTLDQYNSDRVNAASLVTLKSDDYADIIVPTTYIKVAPTTVTSGFNRMVMGLDVGVVPDTLDFSYVTEEVKSLFSALTGLTDVTVTMYTAPMTGTLTPEQAASFEANRQAAIENRQTFFAKVEDLQRQLNTEKSIRQRYEQLIVQAGIPV